ncbi:MAG: carbon-nitrogen hydrolase [Acidobacteria bacterium]|nr:MAG: carbon-nitrogen hydrolase [Acidobacteriota bacterium]GIK78717.1 MAG: carbon-nitrogen hydrolase [Actinomycetes bacterium]
MRALLVQIEAASEPHVGASEAAALLESDVDLAVFPELHLTGYDLARVDERAIAADSAPMMALRDAAAGTDTAVIVGFAERIETGIANSLALIDSDGELAGVYRKTHLFAREREVFEQGNELMVTELAGVRIGPMICFDCEFPEPARALAGAGAELLVTSSANMAPYFHDHLIASQARALDNRRPHLYVNRIGEQGGHRFVGGTRYVTADGRIEAAVDDEEKGLLRVELHPGAVREIEVDYLPRVREDIEVIGPRDHGRIT